MTAESSIDARRQAAIQDATQHVLIIGAGLGGVRTAQQLRAAGHTGRITLVGDEKHLPYDRPPLSKQFLSGEWEPAQLSLVSQAEIRDLGVEIQLGATVTALHVGKAELADGRVLGADAFVIATGVTPRTLPGQPDSVLSLRTLDDGLALRAALRRARSVVVVGGGFIGAEVSSTAIAMGVEVTIIEALAAPMSRVLGPAVGGLCARVMREGGVNLRTGAAIRSVTEGPGELRFELQDGSQVSADVGVVGIGGQPRLELFAGLGIDVRAGLLCDESGRVLRTDNVWALGDTASWRDGVRGGHHRQEHWTAVTEQAAIVARAIVGLAPPPATVPYVWSDQFGYRIQVWGRPDIASDVQALHGDGLAGGDCRGTVVGYFAEDQLVGVVGFSAARKFGRYRPLVLDHASRREAVGLATEMQSTSY
jgi:NADPH-dependent 2,4-dienoyl-CoA reductase/sulfur reductase-like enzyme